MRLIALILISLAASAVAGVSDYEEWVEDEPAVEERSSDDAGVCPTSGQFVFEGDKVLLYTIRARIGQSAYKTFNNRGNNAIPDDRSLPKLYRADALDNLASVIRSTGSTKVVAEMRAGGSVVAQAVFDVRNPDGITKDNWFSAARVVSSQPFSIGTSGYNFFSVAGHDSVQRRFFINFNYGGCEADSGLFVVSDARDNCKWLNKYWTGAAPSLVYNPKGRGATYNKYVAEADQFLIYLSGRGEDGLFRFEPNRVLLYSIRSKIGRSAYNTYISGGNNALPSDLCTVPKVYRADALDNLASVIRRTGSTKIVVEMRAGGAKVAQAVFDVRNPDGITKENWFGTDHLVSSYPYWIGTSGFNYFAIGGDAGVERRFFINFNYGGCENDSGLFVVMDARDPCLWANRFWTGAGPSFVYNPKGRGTPTEKVGAEADQFLIYLQ